MEVSADAQTWTTVHEEAAADGGVDEIALEHADLRYVRMTGTARATPYGYSLYEIEVLGEFTEQAVSLATPSAQVREKGTLRLPVRLNKAAGTAVTVAYATADGTAVAGEDYQAATGTLTFAPGETAQTIAVRGVDDTADEPNKTFTVSLLDPSAGVLVSPRAETVVTVLDDDVPPTGGEPRTIRDFEGDVPIGPGPAGIFTFGGDADDHPQLTVPQLARAGAPADNHVLNVAYHAQLYGGVVDNLFFDRDPQDWSGYLGIRFWWYGGNTAPLPPGSGQADQLRDQGRRRQRRGVRAVDHLVHRRLGGLAPGRDPVRRLRLPRRLPAGRRHRPDRST